MGKLLLLIFFFTFSLLADEKVSIQLKWKHSFQFAGYYAALEKGFFKELGLDVKIKEVDLKKDFIASVANGKSEYGVSDSSLVVYRSKGFPVVLVAQIFQHSPLVFISHRDSNILTPYDMIDKKVMFSLHKGGDAPFRALILKTIGDFKKLKIYDFTSYQDFIDKKVDVISAYSTNQPYWLKKKGIEVNIIDPKSYGIDFYGDNFFTNQKELKEHPDRVKKMRKAILKGWKYALKHQDEMIDIILRKYAPSMTRDELEFQARGIFQMIMPDLTELGSYRDERYKQVIKTYHQLNIIKNDKIEKDFFYDPKKNRINFTKKEQLWIKNHPLVLVGGGPDWAPFDFVDENGKYCGIANDYLKLISKKSGLKFKVIVDKWSNNLKKIKESKIDLLDAVYLTPERKKYMNFTSSYFEMLDYFFIRDDLKVDSIKDLDGKRVAMPRGYAHGDILKKEFPKIKIVWVDTFLEAIDAVLQKKADALFDTYVSISYVLRKNSISNIIPFRPYRGKGVKKLHMATSKNNLLLASIIDKALKSITQDEKNIIYTKWIKNSVKSSLNLTEKERKYLLKNKTVTFSGEPNRLPFETFDSSGRYTGIIAEYIKEISKITSLEFKALPVNTWSELRKFAIEKKVDIISADSDDLFLSKNYKALKPYFETPVVIIMNTEQGFVNDLSDIENKKIGVVKKYGYVNSLKKIYKDITFVTFDSVDKLLSAIEKSKCQAGLLSMPTAAYMIKIKGYQNLKIVGKTTVMMKPTLFVRKDKPLLYGILEKALLKFDYKKTHQILGKWQKVEFAKKTDYTLVLWIVIVFSLFLFLSIYWMRKLTKEIKRREIIEEELKKAKDEALKANQAKSEFLANMSHEIRTPMNSVIGFSELLSKQIKDPIQKDYLESILRGGQSLLRIINDILDLSKIEAGRVDIVLESVDIRSLIKEVESVFLVKFTQKNLNFEVLIDEDIPKYLLLDGTRVRQILFNLIGNAVKFTNHGSIKLAVKKKSSDKKRSKIDLMISVEDSGIGIKKEYLDEIFEAFKQEDAEVEKKYGGTGLGLTICKKLVSMMNGEIFVQSKEGVGSKFTVVLKDVAISSVESDTKNSKKLLENIYFDKYQILVVDDMEDNRKLVSTILITHGLKVLEAKNGQEAIDIVKKSSVDLILMDIKMPVLNGYDATTVLKSDPLTQNIPVIALTASVLGEDIQKFKKYGFDGYLKKPVTQVELLSEIGRFLSYKSVEIKKEDKVKLSKNLPKVIETLEKSYLPKSQEIKDMGDFTIIEEFANSLEKLAKKEEVDSLLDFATQLKLYCDSFDIEKVDYMLNNFKTFVENLKGIKV